MAPPTPYGQEPTFTQKVSSNISRNLPGVTAKFINLVTRAFVGLWRFIAEMIRDAFGK